MKNTLDPELTSDEKAVLDAWDQSQSPRQPHDQEFTCDEKAVLDAWDKANLASQSEQEAFKARLLATLDELEGSPAQSTSSAVLEELDDEMICIDIAAEARSEEAPRSCETGTSRLMASAVRYFTGLCLAQATAIASDHELRYWDPHRARPSVWTQARSIWRLCSSLSFGWLDPLYDLTIKGVHDRDSYQTAATSCGRENSLLVFRDLYEKVMVDSVFLDVQASYEMPDPVQDSGLQAAQRCSSKQVVLFLETPPRAIPELQPPGECADIQRELEVRRTDDNLRFESRWATDVRALICHLSELDPAVIHLNGQSGRGGHDGHGADVGLALEDDQGRPQYVSAQALTTIVHTSAHNVRLVVLNACHSDVLAEALRTRIDCVIRLNELSNHDDARAFIAEFYAGLGSLQSVGRSFERGIAALTARHVPYEAQPRCMPRTGVDLHRTTITEPRQTAELDPDVDRDAE